MNIRDKLLKVEDRILEGLAAFLNRFGKTDSLPLLDLGNHRVKLLKGKYLSPGNWEVDFFKEVESPREMVLSFLIPQFFYDPENLKLILRFLKDEYFKGESYLLLNLPDSAFNINVLKVSNILFRESPLNAVRRELSLLLPFKINQYQIQYMVLDRQELFSEVMVLSVVQNNLKDLLKIFQEEGLYPLRVETSALNIFNSFQFFLGQETSQGENTAVLHFSHESTFMAVFSGDNLKVFNRHGFGVDFLIRTLAKSQGIDLGSATRMLMEESIILPEYGPEQEENPLFMGLREPLLKLLETIFDFFEEFLSRFRLEKIDRILISGGLAGMKNFNFLLENNFKIPVFRFSDLAEVKAPLGNESNMWVNSAGPLLGMLVQ